EAIARLDELLVRFADDTEAMMRATELLFRYAPAERVVVACRDVLARFAGVLGEPAESALLYRLGDSLRRTGQFEEAVVALDDAAGRDPLSTAPLVALRAVYTAQRRWVEVSRTLVRHLERA